MGKQGNIKAIIFDFDGTLAILPINYGRMRKKLGLLFSRYGIKSDFHPLIDSTSEALSELKRRDVTSVEEIESKAYDIIDNEELEAVKKAELAQGARDIFECLKGRDIGIIIISRNGSECINEFISKFNLPEPNMIVSREDSKNLKPHPEHVLFAIEKLRLQPKQLLIVGDSYHDIDVGRSLGIPTALVKWSKHTQEQLNADFLISSLLDLTTLL